MYLSGTPVALARGGSVPRHPQHQELNVPPELERIVSKALTRDREERYQTMKDLMIDLRSLKRKLEVDAEIERTVEVFRVSEKTMSNLNSLAAAQQKQRESVEAQVKRGRRSHWSC